VSLCTLKGTAIGKKMAVKIYHTKKPLQLLDILRGGTSFDCGGMLGRGGRTCRQNHVTKKFQSWDANTYFSRLMA
jgi:hypothetical protein